MKNFLAIGLVCAAFLISAGCGRSDTGDLNKSSVAVAPTQSAASPAVSPVVAPSVAPSLAPSVVPPVASAPLPPPSAAAPPSGAPAPNASPAAPVSLATGASPYPTNSPNPMPALAPHPAVPASPAPTPVPAAERKPNFNYTATAGSAGEVQAQVNELRKGPDGKVTITVKNGNGDGRDAVMTYEKKGDVIILSGNGKVDRFPVKI